jgi:hypothetical protein
VSAFTLYLAGGALSRQELNQHERQRKVAYGNFKNEFSWSKTRAETLSQCERKYWFSHYGFWGGWAKDCDERTREIYILKKLTNRHAWAGIAVHETIEKFLQKIKSGIDPKSLNTDLEVEQSIERFRQQYRVSLSAKNRINPKNYFRLQEHEYEEDIENEKWVETRDKMVTSLRNFFSSSAWDQIKSIGTDQILSFEELESFNIENTKIWVSLDLALKDETGKIMIWDWKTGEISNDGLNQDIQLGMYLKFSEHKWKTQDIEASLHGLYPEYRELKIHYNEFDWSYFESEFSKSVKKMKSFLNDVDENETEENNFIKSAAEDNPNLCNFCQYRRVCLE